MKDRKIVRGKNDKYRKKTTSKQIKNQKKTGKKY